MADSKTKNGTPPKEFDSPEKMVRLGHIVTAMLDEYSMDPDRNTAFEKYELARDTYDDKVAPSKLEIDPGIETYQIPLLRRVVDVVSSYIAESMTALTPWFVLTGGEAEDETLKERRENDTQTLLDIGAYEAAVRQICYNAVLYNRGPFRVRYRVVESLDGSGEKLECLPVIEPWEPKSFVWYPTSAQHWMEARLIGGYCRMSVREIKRRQRKGEFLAEPVVPVGNVSEGGDQSTETLGQTATAFPDDVSPQVFTGLVWLGMDDLAGGEDPLEIVQDAEAELDYRCYRITMIKETSAIIELSPYDLPVPEWFAPSPNEDTSKFWATNSIASKVLELQAILNDNFTAQILGAVASAKMPVFASNMGGDMDTENSGVGQIYSTPSDARFWSPPVSYRSGDALMNQAHEVQRLADGAARVSEVGAGQYATRSTTATETSAVLAGQMSGVKDYRLTMSLPFQDAIQLVQVLVAKHYTHVAKAHGGLLKTEGKGDWTKKFVVTVNGKTPSNDPQALLQKVQAIIQLATALQVPIDPGQMTIEAAQLLRQLIDSLELPFDTAGIVQGDEQSVDGDAAGGAGDLDSLAAEAQRLLAEQYGSAAETDPVGLPLGPPPVPAGGAASLLPQQFRPPG